MIVVHPVSGTTVAIQGIQQGMDAIRRAAAEVARTQIAPAESVAASRSDTAAFLDMRRYANQTRASIRAARVYHEDLGTVLDLNV